jgi:PadR family transcriptional regulator, regulatory protein PadR
MTSEARGDLALNVLLAIARLGDDAYGLGIQRDIASSTAREYAVGAIYTTLSRLEAKGLVASSWSPPVPARGGRSRRLFHLTAPGTTALQMAHERERLRWVGLDGLLTPGIG